MKKELSKSLITGIDVTFNNKPYSTTNPLDVYVEFDIDGEVEKIEKFLSQVSDKGSSSTSTIASGLVLFKFSSYGEMFFRAEDVVSERFSSTIISSAKEVMDDLSLNPAKTAKALKMLLTYEPPFGKPAVIRVIANFLLYFSHLYHIFDGTVTASQKLIMREYQKDGNSIC